MHVAKLVLSLGDWSQCLAERYRKCLLLGFSSIYFHKISQISMMLLPYIQMAWEIHKMLKSSRLMRRYNPPEQRRVVINGVTVYILVGLFSALGSLEMNSLYPLDSTLHGSLTCGPKPFTKGQTLIVWMFFAPLFVLLPYIYVLYSVLDIYWRKLLPARGKRRILSIYFFRIVAIFLIMWGPVAFLIYFVNELIIKMNKEHASIFAVAVWAHFQAVLSAAVTLTKPNIYHAVINYLTYQPSENDTEEFTEGSSGNCRNSRPANRLPHGFAVFFLGKAVRDSNNSIKPSRVEGSSKQSDGPIGFAENHIWSDMPIQSVIDFQFTDKVVEALVLLTLHAEESGKRMVANEEVPSSSPQSNN